LPLQQEGNRLVELLFFEYLRRHKPDIKAARIFNTYGPRMQPVDGRVLSILIVKKLDVAVIRLIASAKRFSVCPLAALNPPHKFMKGKDQYIHAST
jgi:nucleoside-diphosphate-sugar epimerase